MPTKANGHLETEVLQQAADAVEWLKQHGNQAGRDGMTRYAIPSECAFGVAMRDIQSYAKQLGRHHALALTLWETGWYEARTLAAYVDEPTKVTARQVDQWCRDFDNWAICDSVCFVLFDKTVHAWKKLEKLARAKPEFEKRAAFALLWGLSRHDKAATDAQFLAGLALIEREAVDDRNFVKKAVNMALRAIGKRNRALNRASMSVSTRLAESDNNTAQWVGRDALKELTSAKVLSRFKA